MDTDKANSPYAPSRPPIAPDRDDSRLLLVDFRSGESVAQHPEIAPLLNDGWHIRSAVPRIVETEGTKLLVVVSRGTSTRRFAPAASRPEPVIQQ